VSRSSTVVAIGVGIVGTAIGVPVETCRETASRRDPPRDAFAATTPAPGDRNDERISRSTDTSARRRSPSLHAANAAQAWRTAQARFEGPRPAAVASSAAQLHARARCTGRAPSTGRHVDSGRLVQEALESGRVRDNGPGSEEGAPLPRTTARLTPPVSSARHLRRAFVDACSTLAVSLSRSRLSIRAIVRLALAALQPTRVAKESTTAAPSPTVFTTDQMPRRVAALRILQERWK